MKNCTFSCFLLLLLSLVTSKLLAFNELDKPTPPPGPCEAPAPAWLVATNITPTSISLAWEASQLFMFYKCDAYDLTGGFPLPTAYVTTPFHTWNGLTPGHTYKFDVRASYCEEGPYGEPVTRQATTSTIIIDIVLELNRPCTPNNTLPTGSNTMYALCVQQSSASTAPYSNGYVGKLQVDANNFVHFGLAGVSEAARFGPVNFNGPSNPKFTFPDNSNHPTWAECLYMGTPIFRVDFVEYSPMPGNNTGWTSLTILFYDTFMDFSYCPLPTSTCAGGGLRGSEEPSKMSILDGLEVGITSRNAEVELHTGLIPNPFHTSTVFQYESNEVGTVNIALYDALGRLVRVVENTPQKAPGFHEITLDGEGLPDGVYFLKTQIGQTHKVLRLVKQE